jgi:hypothetical protein
MDNLREGLLKNPTHRALYLNSPSFHSGIDVLVNMLPAWVEGMANQAIKMDLRHQEMVDLARHGVVSTLVREQLDEIFQQTNGEEL